MAAIARVRVLRGLESESMEVGVSTQHGSTPARRRAALALLGLAVLSLPAALAVLAPPERLHDPVLFAALIAIALACHTGQVTLKTRVPVKVDAGYAVVLIAVAFWGPAAGLAVYLTWDVANRLIVREYAVFTTGALANLASYGWSAIAGAELLRLAGVTALEPRALAGLFTAGVVMALVQFAIARLLYGTLYQGYRAGPLISAELTGLLPAVLVDVALGTLTAMLIEPLGIGAFALLAPVVLIPSVVLPALVRNRPVSLLDLPAATGLYAAALADVLRLPRRSRRVIAQASRFMYTQTYKPHSRSDELYEVMLAAMYASERFDGSGGPAGLRGGMIPLECRVLAVADAWARLTARSTKQLSHTEALLALELAAGSELDPTVVAAAGEVVHTELPWATESAFQPVLHRLPLPRAVRRETLPHALAGAGHA
jgi:HD domain